MDLTAPSPPHASGFCCAVRNNASSGWCFTPLGLYYDLLAAGKDPHSIYLQCPPHLQRLWPLLQRAAWLQEAEMTLSTLPCTTTAWPDSCPCVELVCCIALLHLFIQLPSSAILEAALFDHHERSQYLCEDPSWNNFQEDMATLDEHFLLLKELLPPGREHQGDFNSLLPRPNPLDNSDLN